MLTIRRAVYEDIPHIMEFMDEHWKPGNILAKDRNFFEWQFVEDGKVNMILGIDEENGTIYGMLGVIVYNGSEHPDVSACTWQTIKSSDPMLGVELLDAMWAEYHYRFACSAGLTKKSIKINTLLGGVPTQMDHYYRLADIENYKIAVVKNKNIPKAEKTGYRLERIYLPDEMKEIISEEQLKTGIMSKDYRYIRRRYFEHPVYRYDIWKIVNPQGKAEDVLITREEVIGKHKICKVIDFYGEVEKLGKMAAAFDALMAEKRYEYVDIYSYGVPTTIYENGGFVCCDETSENIIPNYFHPFVQENIVLRMMEPPAKETVLFRGDGDQDRPC